MKRMMIVAILLSGCKPQAEIDNAAAPAPTVGEQAAWSVSTAWNGPTLSYSEHGRRAISLTCPKDDGRLVVNVPAFKIIGSEERLSLGSGETVVTLVANVRGEP